METSPLVCSARNSLLFELNDKILKIFQQIRIKNGKNLVSKLSRRF
ncbi:hypothetical protein NTHI1209_01910 [Haemophilus influenzae]|uniref:Uncharacterized protein n=1 Tax=Haemophilus influenzae TaxID=727 RepID=A0A158SZH5_HAEIF|nr:hypothetical protein NTHI1209_01910 [Haemophilus influenzae]